MDQIEKKRFWRKLLGYKIGEEVVVTYETTASFADGIPRKGTIFISGKVVEITKDAIILESLKNVRIKLLESKILDVRTATKADMKKLHLNWGETLESYLKRIKQEKD